MYVNAKNHQAAFNVMKLSCELGGFPLVDAVFEPTDKDQNYRKSFNALLEL